MSYSFLKQFGGAQGARPYRHIYIHERVPTLPAEPPFKAYVSRLPTGLTQADFERIFENQTVFNATANEKKETSYFVEFANLDHLKDALLTDEAEFDGKAMHVDVAIDSRSARSQRHERVQDLPTKPPFKAYVSCLPTGLTQADFTRIFEDQTVRNVTVNKRNGTSYFVEVANLDDLKEALLSDRAVFDGKAMRVAVAIDRRKPTTGRRY